MSRFDTISNLGNLGKRLQIVFDAYSVKILINPIFRGIRMNIRSFSALALAVLICGGTINAMEPANVNPTQVAQPVIEKIQEGTKALEGKTQDAVKKTAGFLTKAQDSVAKQWKALVGSIPSKEAFNKGVSDITTKVTTFFKNNKKAIGFTLIAAAVAAGIYAYYKSCKNANKRKVATA